MASLPVAFAANSSDRKLKRLARELLRLRNRRQQHFPVDATGPAWDLLLALFAVDDSSEISVGELVERTNVARTTAVRWLRRLQRHGLATLTPDAQDRRLVRVGITETGAGLMQSLLGQSAIRA